MAPTKHNHNSWRGLQYLTAIVIHADGNGEVKGAKYRGIHTDRRKSFYKFVSQKFPTLQHINFYRNGKYLERVNKADL